MGKIVIAAMREYHIHATIADYTIIGSDARLNSEQTDIINIINDALVQDHFWVCIDRRFLRHNSLVSIFYHGISKLIVFTAAPEINAWPACRKFAVRNV